MNQKLLLATALSLLLAACSPAPADKLIEIHLPNDGNLCRYPDLETVQATLDSVVSMGFNAIVVDIKPPVGYTCYESSLIPNIRNARTYPNHEKTDFDMARTFLDEGHKRHLKVTLSSAMLSMGAWPLDVDGPAYTVPEFGEMTCVEYLPDGLRDIKESRDFGIFAFLNPALPKVHDLMVAHVREVCQMYKPDGFMLDYCRFNNYHSDFSEASHKAFEAYVGEPVEDFPFCIYTYPGDNPWEIVPGKYYRKWMEWRSMLIRDLVADCAKAIKEVSPATDVVVWTGSWWPWIQGNGQNWGSPTTTWIAEHRDQFDFATPDYEKTGFADLLDIYELGAYLPYVYGMDNEESMEYAIARGKALNDGACTFVGSVGTEAPLRDAFELMYRETAGISFFALDACFGKPEKYAELREAVAHAKAAYHEKK
ncbi:MAG: family 10 glycosylhydrolase [Bacteroidales bacterium]|nr:family 10 glycosylhydrolase [Bacteroidales bacterium]